MPIISSSDRSRVLTRSTAETAPSVDYLVTENADQVTENTVNVTENGP